mgnify:CR=1 FL=1
MRSACDDPFGPDAALPGALGNRAHRNHDIGRAEYVSATDSEALAAFTLLCETEGIIPAIESAHALVGAMEVGRELGPEGLVLVNLSGRGDKDMHTAAEWFGLVEPGDPDRPAAGTTVDGGAEDAAVDGPAADEGVQA